MSIEESTLAVRAAVLRNADIAFVMAGPMSKELLAEARRIRFIQKFGAVGKQVAKRLRSFGVTIFYYDPVRATREV